jgi:hypothetical protein
VSILAIIVFLVAAALVAAAVLWEFGAHQLLAAFGRGVVFSITLGHIRLPGDPDDSMAVAVGAFTIIGLFLSLILLAAYIQ